MFKFNGKHIEDLEDKLRQLNSRGFGFATKETLNDAAFAAMRIAKADLPKKMILKNKFTQASIRVNKTKTLHTDKQRAAVGSTQDYLERQEFGGMQRGGRVGKPIATSEAAGQGDANPRTKDIRPSNRLSRLRLGPSSRKMKAMSKARRVQATIQGALDSGNRKVYLELSNGTKGIFRLKGGKKKARLRMLYDLSEKNIRTPANPWLRPAFDEAVRMMPAFYADALRRQLRRL